MHCFVTGCSGFVGSHLARELLRRGHTVTALVRPGANLERISDCVADMHIIEGTLHDLGSLESAVSDRRFDAACHLAWFGVTAGYRNDFGQITDNVMQSLALWRILESVGCRIWLSVGSQAEYGLYSGVLREDLPPRPATAYGAAKLALCILTQRLCAMAGVRFLWMRLFSTYGPGDDEQHMVPALIRSLLRGEMYPLTSGEQVWDFLYISDVIDALVAGLETETADGIFNLASGKPGLLRDFMQAVRDEVDPSLPLGIGKIPYRPDQVMHLEGDVSRLREATQWSPRVDWAEGIRRTVQSHRQKEEVAARGI
jgi:UDP-glucose 4-epimerase